MQLQHPLRVIAPTVDADVLTVLARADHEFTISTMERMIGSRSTDGIRRTLARLVDQGIVHRKIVGRTHAFTLNRRHLAAPAIIELASLQDLLLSRMGEAVSNWQEPALYVALFGSGARGEMRPASDLDVLLIRQGSASALWHDQVDHLMSDITAWTGNDARALDLSADEIRGRMADDSVLSDVLHAGLPVHGEPTTLRRLVAAL